jgi:hypothetical protein
MSHPRIKKVVFKPSNRNSKAKELPVRKFIRSWNSGEQAVQVSEYMRIESLLRTNKEKQERVQDLMLSYLKRQQELEQLVEAYEPLSESERILLGIDDENEDKK